MIARTSKLPLRFAVAAVLILLGAMLSPQLASADTGWRGEYYTNPYLAGSPTLVRTDAAVDFTWNSGSPAGGIPADRYSVRWSRTLNLASGVYRFATRTDDGVRLFVDGALVIDRWYPMPPTTHTADVPVSAGNHNVRMEYYEWTGVASAKLWWTRVGDEPGTGTSWRGEYYGNPNLSGTPALVRYDDDIDFDWDRGSPTSAIPANDFSVRWTRAVSFDAARYNFFAKADDGVRVYVDGQLVIDQWRLATGSTHKGSVQMAAGTHRIKVEYYEHTGLASIDVWWERAGGGLIGNIITCMRPADSWIKVYRQMPDGTWQDMNPHGWGPLNATGIIKIDGLPVDSYYGNNGQPYRVELWAGGSLIRTVGAVSSGQAAFYVYPWTDSHTPWPCPAP